MRHRPLAMFLAIAAVCAAPALADQPAATSPKMVSRMGLPYKPDDDQIGPKELVDAIRARRSGGKLLNLDRMLLHSAAYAKGWNTLFGAIRGQLAVPPRLRELTIMAVGSLLFFHVNTGKSSVVLDQATPSGRDMLLRLVAACDVAVVGADADVAAMQAANPLAVITPCHRVVRADGGLSGYRWGVECKAALLAREAA